MNDLNVGSLEPKYMPVRCESAMIKSGLCEVCMQACLPESTVQVIIEQQVLQRIPS